MSATTRRRKAAAEGAAAELQRDPAVGRELARERADADEHRHDGDDGEREVGRAAGGQARGDEADEGREPEDDGARGDRDERRDERAASADDPREHELLPAGVLLGAHRADGGEQPPDRGEDREGAADAPGDVARRR